MGLLFILLLLLGGLGLWIVSIYNKLIRYIEAVNNDKKQIDIQLDRRYKLFESLINIVKNYMDYEKTTLKDVVALRARAQEASARGDAEGKIAAEDAISKIASNINLVFEQYPDLKANQNALQLQESVVNTEDKLAFAKQAYNNSIQKYNETKRSFFESMVVGIFADKLDKDFVYWNIPEDQIAQRESYTVNLNEPKEPPKE